MDDFRFAGHMYALVCQNVLLESDERGLFHSLSKEEEEGLSSVDVSMVQTLTAKCAHSTDLNARESAGVDLLDILTADEDDEEEDEQEEGDEGQEDVNQEDETEVGDEDLGEDQYEKAHDAKVVRTKDDKYDFVDGVQDHKKDMQFP